MKTFKLLFATLILCSISMNAQMKALQRGDAGVPITSYPQEEYEKSERKYLGITTGADIQNALWGGKKLDDGTRRNEQAYDGTVRLLYGRGSTETGVFAELFSAIGYKAVGLDFNYVGRIWNDAGLLYIGGAEIRMIWRDSGILFPANGSSSYGSRTRTFGFNNRLRVENIFGSKFGVELHSNWQYRADVRDLAENNLQKEPIPKFWDSFSSYLSIVYYF